MEAVIHEDIVIAGGGIAGLSTALALHRLGIRSLVLEGADSLRQSGFGITVWTNAWRALDAIGVGDILRSKSTQIRGFEINACNSDSSDPEKATHRGDYPIDNCELRCLRRMELLETLERELPKGTIRYSSEIISIKESGNLKFVHLSNGSIFSTKVVIGCDGINSMVSKWLGLQSPVKTGRLAIRGSSEYPSGHGLGPKFRISSGGGLRCGLIPYDDNGLYWFCSFNPSMFKYDENENNPLKIKQFVLNNIINAPRPIQEAVERTSLDSISCVSLKLRLPWNLLTGNIVKNNVCVAGDALHPMTPDIGQGGCSSLEESVVLARSLAESLSSESSGCDDENDGDYVKMERGLNEYAKQRRWRSFSLITTSYVVGLIQESNGRAMRFMKRLFLGKYTVGAPVRMADYDCGKLMIGG